MKSATEQLSVNPFKKYVKKCAGVGLISSVTLFSTAAIAEATNKTPLSERVRAVIREYATKEHLKEFAKDKAKDQVKDHVADLIMALGDKYIHGPFTKGGGDEDVTREVVDDVAGGPGGLAQLPLIMVKIILTGSELAPPSLDDVPQVTSNDGPPDQPTTSPAQRNSPGMPGPSNDAPPVSNPTAPNPDRPMTFPSISIAVPGNPGHNADSGQHAGDRQGDADSRVSPSSASAQHSEGGLPKSDPSELDHMGGGHPIEIKAGGPALAESHPDNTIHGEVPGQSNTAQPGSPPDLGRFAGFGPLRPTPVAPAQAPSSQRGEPGGHGDPAAGSHEINHGTDKPDHNTPGGRDVSDVASNKTAQPDKKLAVAVAIKPIPK